MTAFSEDERERMNREYIDKTKGQIQDVFNLPRFENLETLADNMLDAEERRIAAENVKKKNEMGPEDEYVEMGRDGQINAVKENQLEQGGENQLNAQEGNDDIEEPRDEVSKGDDVDGKKRYNFNENLFEK